MSALTKIYNDVRSEREETARQMALATAEAVAAHLKRAQQAEELLEVERLNNQYLQDDIELLTEQLNQKDLKKPSRAGIFGWSLMAVLFLVLGAFFAKTPEQWGFFTVCTLIALGVSTIKTDILGVGDDLW